VPLAHWNSEDVAVQTLWQGLPHGARVLKKNPGFSKG
jgi:hypothetical protein